MAHLGVPIHTEVVLSVNEFGAPSMGTKFIDIAMRVRNLSENSVSHLVWWDIV